MARCAAMTGRRPPTRGAPHVSGKIAISDVHETGPCLRHCRLYCQRPRGGEPLHGPHGHCVLPAATLHRVDPRRTSLCPARGEKVEVVAYADGGISSSPTRRCCPTGPLTPPRTFRQRLMPSCSLRGSKPAFRYAIAEKKAQTLASSGAAPPAQPTRHLYLAKSGHVYFA